MRLQSFFKSGYIAFLEQQAGQEAMTTTAGTKAPIDEDIALTVALLAATIRNKVMIGLMLKTEESRVQNLPKVFAKNGRLLPRTAALTPAAGVEASKEMSMYLCNQLILNVAP